MHSSNPPTHSRPHPHPPSQKLRVASGATTSTGAVALNSCSRLAMWAAAVAVLPRPWSSASTAARRCSHMPRSQEAACSWWGRRAAPCTQGGCWSTCMDASTCWAGGGGGKEAISSETTPTQQAWTTAPQKHMFTGVQQARAMLHACCCTQHAAVHIHSKSSSLTPDVCSLLFLEMCVRQPPTALPSPLSRVPPPPHTRHPTHRHGLSLSLLQRRPLCPLGVLSGPAHCTTLPLPQLEQQLQVLRLHERGRLLALPSARVIALHTVREATSRYTGQHTSVVTFESMPHNHTQQQQSSPHTRTNTHVLHLPNRQPLDQRPRTPVPAT